MIPLPSMAAVPHMALWRGDATLAGTAMDEPNCKPVLDQVAKEESTNTYTTPNLVTVGSTKDLLQDTFSQRYREVTSRYTTYWGGISQ